MRLLLNVLKIKWIFKKPSKKKVLVYDRESEKFSKLLFSKKSCEFLETRYESINIYILFFTIFNSGLNSIKDNYKKNYIKRVSPKIVYTSIDNNISFYKLKDIYNKPTYISDQNGISKVTNAFWPNSFTRECKKYKKENKKNLKADILFLFGKNEKDRISPLIDGKIYTYGNTINNHYPIKLNKLNKKVTSIMFISSGLFKATLKHEQTVFANLNKFCIKKNIKLSFCSRLDASGEDFHRKTFAKGPWIYLPRAHLNKNYSYLNKQQMVVFAHSTFGFEALAKGLKCGVFYSHFPEKNSHLKYPKSGPFWTNSLDYNMFEKTLNRVINLSNKQWKKIIANFSSEILDYDLNNKKKKKIIKMALKL